MMRPVPENIMACDTSNRCARKRVVMRKMTSDTADDRSLDAAPRFDWRGSHQARWERQREKKLDTAH